MEDDEGWENIRGGIRYRITHDLRRNVVIVTSGNARAIPRNLRNYNNIIYIPPNGPRFKRRDFLCKLLLQLPHQRENTCQRLNQQDRNDNYEDVVGLLPV